MNTNRQQNLAKSVKRYRIIAWIAVLICLLIIGKVVYVGTLKREYWKKVAEQKKVKEKPEPAERGNILSCDGRLLSGTLPEYDLIIDFSVCQEWRDSMWRADFPKICAGLHRIFPDKSEEYFRDRLQEGYDKKNKSWSYSKDGDIRELFSFNEDGSIQACLPNGQKMNVEQNEIGLYQLRMAVNDGLYFACNK